MSKKMIVALAFLVTAFFIGFNPIPAHAMGFTPNSDPTPVEPEDDSSDEESTGIYSDVYEMADRIVVTEENILIMSDRIVETEDIVATVSPADDFDSEALDASAEVRDDMDYGLIPNFLPQTDLIDSLLPENETVLGLSDDIGEMADRILYTEDEIGTMADRIVETEYLIADTIDALDFTDPNLTLDDLSEAPELGEHSIGQVIETVPSTDTVTEAVPYDSLEVLDNDSSENDVLILSEDIGDMADNILDTEGDIGDTSDNIVETEYELSDSLVSIWN